MTYVALLSAAELHGAAHQRPQSFQVMVKTNRRAIECGEVRVQFVARKDMERTPAIEKQTPRGLLRVASPEATALELVGYADQSGGLAIHDALDPWLGKPKWKQTAGRVTLNYRFDSEDAPPVALKLKVEINSREHVTVHGLHDHRFEVASRWFTGAADVRTYELDELLGTKLRALYQRKKGRDLFDLGLALDRSGPSSWSSSWGSRRARVALQ